MRNISTILGGLWIIFALAAILTNTPFLNTAYAQEGPPGEAGVTDEPEPDFAPLNMTGPETATEFEEIAGSDAAILANNTDISNPNNTMLDATDVNIMEDCMQIPGNTEEDCP